MSVNITYLLGAGASALTMPTVAKFRKALSDLEKDLENRKIVSELFNKAPDITAINDAATVIADLQILNKELINFSSIDTFARYLYFTAPSRLPAFKALINFCFTYWHFHKGIDKRYDGFLSLLLQDKGGKPYLPSNVKILSWNYDLQLESTIGRYMGKQSLAQLEHTVNIFPCIDENKELNADEFCLFKLNGSAQAFWNDLGSVSKNDIPFEFFNDNNLSKEQQNRYLYLTQIVVRDYKENIGTAKGCSYISYSWEQSEVNKRNRKIAKNITSKTEILVVIGYSFPQINRGIDEEFIKNMAALSKVYIQSPPASYNSVVERFASLAGISLKHMEHSHIDIIPIKGTDEFCVPDELFYS